MGGEDTVKAWKIAGTGLIGAAAIIAAAARGERAVGMHELDWEGDCVPSGGRRYRGLSHFAYHQRELLGMVVPLARVYLLRAIEPAFREQIMIVTAMSNSCAP